MYKRIQTLIKHVFFFNILHELLTSLIIVNTTSLIVHVKGIHQILYETFTVLVKN